VVVSPLRLMISETRGLSGERIRCKQIPYNSDFNRWIGDSGAEFPQQKHRSVFSVFIRWSQEYTARSVRIAKAIDNFKISFR